MIWKYVSKLCEYENMGIRYYELLDQLEIGIDQLEKENKKLKEKKNGKKNKTI